MSHDHIKILNNKSVTKDQKGQNKPQKRPGAPKEDQFKINVNYKNMKKKFY